METCYVYYDFIVRNLFFLNEYAFTRSNIYSKKYRETPREVCPRMKLYLNIMAWYRISVPLAYAYGSNYNFYKIDLFLIDKQFLQ